MNKTRFVFGMMALWIWTGLASCDRNKTDDTAAEGGYGTDNARLEQTFDDVQNIADQAATTGTLSNYKVEANILSNCATITHDTTVTPHVLTIDFGSTNCLCMDGRYRRGQIIVTYNGHYRDSGYVHTITFNNYFVNNHQVTGTKTVTNMGHNPAGNLYYNISVNGSIILANNGGTLSWTSSRTRTWVAGEGTATRSDDVYEITGNASITRPNGNTFTMNITAPLKVALNCYWIEQGTIQMTAANGVVRTLDYGNGNCDNQATVTMNGNTYYITLP